MAALTITAASVLPGTGATTVVGTGGATITAGQTVYKDATDGKFKLADNDISAAAATLYGVALNGCSDGQPLTVLTAGPLTAGATVTVGEVYCLGATAGTIVPKGDLVTGKYVSVLGVGISASQIQVQILNSGVTVP